MEKEEKGIFFVQHGGRIIISHDIREKIGIKHRDYVSLSIRKATDEEILEKLKGVKGG